MKNFNYKLYLLLGIFYFFVPQLQAGGVFLYEISSADTRFASAGWSARAEDPSTIFTNPAGMTRFEEKQLEMGTQAIYAHVHFDSKKATTVSGSKGKASLWLPSGSFFAIHPCNEKIFLGLASLGYFGADLAYNHHWVGKYYVQKTLLEGISLVPAAAYKLDKNWSIGCGLNIMYGFFKQRAAINNILDGGNDGYFNMHDSRFGYGAIAGILYEPCCHSRFGIQYLSQLTLKLHDTPKFHHLGPKLKDFLTETRLIDTPIHMKVHAPQAVMVSAYHQMGGAFALMGNLGWQQWSKFQKITINLADLSGRSLSATVPYKDTWHAALGTEWRVMPKLKLSAGLACDSSAIKTKDRPLDFPVGKQWRYGAGARWSCSEKMIFDFATTLQWQGKLKVNVNKGPVAGHVKGVFTNTYALFLNANLIYLF